MKTIFAIAGKVCAVHLNELPEVYRSMPIIGRGMTSIVLQDPSDDKKIFLVTKDSTKVDWLLCGFGLALPGTRHVEEFDSYRHRNYKLRDFTITVISLPRLYPLTQKEKGDCKKWFEKVSTDFYALAYKHMRQKINQDTAYGMAASEMSNLLEDSSEYKECPYRENLIGFFDFATNYEKWMPDLHCGNILKDAEGRLILLDPVVSKELFDAIHKRP